VSVRLFRRLPPVPAGGLMWVLLLTAGAWSQEFRAMWVDAFHPGFKTPAEVSQLIAEARAGRFNAVIVEVRKRGDAYYNSNFEPKPADVSPPSFDPLADLIAKAHDTNTGPRIEVHAWLVTYPIWNNQDTNAAPPGHPVRLHPDWLTQNTAGQTWASGNYVFDPGHPEVQRHTFNVAMDIVTRYDIDGLNFDYIRYLGSTWGYNPVAVARFNARYGRTGQPAPDDPQWKQFRRDQVTDLLRKVYLWTLALKPWVKVSVDAIAGTPGPASDLDWTNRSQAYTDKLQDWRAWTQEGILDMVIPMTYFNQAGAYAPDWTNWNAFIKDRRYRRHAIIGPGIYLNTVSNGLFQMRYTRLPSPSGQRADGLCVYSYAVPSSDGTPRSTFLAALTSTNTSHLYETNPEPIFAALASPPDMPWKSAPSLGHLMGTVKAGPLSNTCDGATVSLDGPAQRTGYTDATGFYGFVDLPPGLYTVRAWSGCWGPAEQPVAISAGMVAQADLWLNTNGGPGPTITGVAVVGLSDRSAVIVWTTDSDADSTVEYGLTPVYGAAVVDPAFTRTHQLTLSNLMPETVYHFRVGSRDLCGRAGVSGDLTFQTNPEGVVNDIIIDNPDATVAGSWSTGTSATDKFGPDYRYNGPGTGAEYVEFRPTILEPGLYGVYEWHPQGANRTTNAPHLIVYDGGTQTVFVNQEINGGQWNLLGQFNFAAGTNGMVRITDAFPEPSGNVVLADAIRFAYVPVPPQILQQPQSLTVVAGSNAVFSVSATGSRPLAYQWQFNGLDIPGATTPTLVRSNVQPADAGSYSVRISNRAGVVWSSNATLVVLVRPSIVSGPQSLTVNQGATAIFSVVATGTEPLSYRWQCNGVYLPGATGPVLVLTNVQPVHAGIYSVVVSNVAGMVSSGPATLTVLTPPQILLHPQSQTVAAGASFTFSLLATGSPRLFYQWRLNDADIPGATGPTYTRHHARLSDAGRYTAQVQNSAGTVVTDAAVLTVQPPPPPTLAVSLDTSAGLVRLQFQGQPNCVHTIERSTNLVHWTPVLTLTNWSASVDLFFGMEAPCQFYRAKAE